MLILGITLFMSCDKKKNDYVPLGGNSDQHVVVVKEFLQASGYTYVLVEEDSEEYWMAVSKMEVGPPESMFRHRLQTALSGISKELLS